tara:strand:+ start:8866 stop:10278 length:1413 start_codon:yes stop_codon:yes gene_type:complete
MGRRNKQKPILIENIKIIDTANKGKSIAKYDGRVIFINNGVPGDICDIRILKKRRKFWEGKAEKFHVYSKKRTKPKCEHFGICGGCKWQNMRYEDQLKFKQNEVINNIERIGGIHIQNHNDIIGSKKKYFYRNKMEFTFSNKRWLTEKEIKSGLDIKDRNALGFHIPGRFDKVINLENCYLQEDPSNKIRHKLNLFAQKNKLSYFDIHQQKGLLRNLLIKTTTTGEIMVLIQFYENNISKIKLVMEYIKNTFPNITSLLYTINQKANNTIYDQEIICFNGRDHIIERIDKLVFRIGAKSFFQTNSEQAKNLYRKTKELASISKEDTVYDLYTGTGTIAQYIASSAKKVIGIDSVNEGILAANRNAEINKIRNCIFYTGDMKDIFSDDFIKKNGKPNIIITDPPRDGMHKKVVEQICKIGAQRIIYVSCNTSTQARDVALMKHIYKVTDIQPIDMFPQTHHVENILVLEKR